MKHAAIPLRRLLSEQPEPATPIDEEGGLADYYSSMDGEPDESADEQEHEE